MMRLATLKQIQAMPNVLSADPVYTYSEGEPNQERENMEQSYNLQDWLNDENTSLKYIHYKGDLNGASKDFTLFN